MLLGQAKWSGGPWLKEMGKERFGRVAKREDIEETGWDRLCPALNDSQERLVSMMPSMQGMPKITG